MLGRFDRVPREAECDRMLRTYGANRWDAIGAALERQFATIHNRAQVLLGICGILISASVLITTGRIIGRPSIGAQVVASRVLVAAGIFEISAAAVVVVGVLNVRWITQQPGDDLRAWILSNLEYRDGKTRAYRLAIVLVLLSMLCYQTAIFFALTQL